MKKIHMVVLQKDTPNALESLREIGCVHVDHLVQPVGGQTAVFREALNKHSQAISLLQRCKADPKKCNQEKNITMEERMDCVNSILELDAEAERLEGKIEKIETHIKTWELWGDFQPGDLRDLIEHKIFVHLYEIPAKEKVEIPDGVIMETVNVKGGVRRCIAVLRENTQLDYQRVYPPTASLKEMKQTLEKETKRLEEAKHKLRSFCCYLDDLRKGESEMAEILQFEEAAVGMQAEGELSVLKGFCPVDQVEVLEDKAREENWALSVENPSDEDEVPTLLKNPKPVELSQPALNMVEILPGYREVDVSAVFIVFFTLFFAILIGDAAYGAIFFLLTAFCQFKFGNKLQDKKPFYLMYLLTGATMIWGVLTGTYFGQQWVPATFAPVVPWLNEPQNIQWLCFTIALIHLSIAHVWAAKLKFPALTMLSEIGWLLVVWGMYFLANMFVLNHEFPQFALWFFVVGIPMAFIFMFPLKEFSKKAPQESIPFALGVVGAGTDIISYIRLFAVGLATVAVADAANSMPEALPMLGIGYGFMVFLHILNMILAAMAILVHAIRLNVLEFSGHLNLEWAGIPYQPFHKTQKV